MNIEITEAGLADQPTFRNLFQFYLYEFSRYLKFPVGYAGQYMQDDLEGCWTQETRHPFLVKLEGDLAGFAIVDTLEKSPITGTAGRVIMAEFFIMAAYQGRGAGKIVATRLFDRFPGTWEVFQVRENTPAQAFWRKVIGAYTGGKYQEIDAPQGHGILQVFDTADRVV